MGKSAMGWEESILNSENVRINNYSFNIIIWTKNKLLITF